MKEYQFYKVVDESSLSMYGTDTDMRGWELISTHVIRNEYTSYENKQWTETTNQITLNKNVPMPQPSVTESLKLLFGMTAEAALLWKK